MNLLKNRKMRWKPVQKAVLAILLVVINVLFTCVPFQIFDYTVSDWIYQENMLFGSPGKYYSHERDIVLIKLEDQSINDLGFTYAGDRSRWVELIEGLCQEEENKPAVIALDILFEGVERRADGTLAGNQSLAEACKGNPVVVASSYQTMLWDELVLNKPYQELAEVVTYGLTNTVAEIDHRIRHYQIKKDVNGDKKYSDQEEYSFAYKVAETYAQSRGDEQLKKRLKELAQDKDQFYLEFNGNLASFENKGHYNQYTLAEVLKWIENKDTEKLKAFSNKIVLVGRYDGTKADIHDTAIDRNLYGVLVHASAILAFLEEGYLPPTEANSLVDHCIFTALVLLLFLLSGVLDLAFLAILTLGLSASSLYVCRFLLKKGWIMHASWIPTGMLLILIYMVICYYNNRTREKWALQMTFERYLDPKIAQQIVNTSGDKVKLKGEERDITVMFADVCGFTPLSQKYEAEKIVAMLNEYFELANHCIWQYGGTLDKFIGDCVMAVWNAPVDVADPELQAVHAALDLIQGIAKVRESTGMDVHLAIGIHSGKGISGNLGSVKHMDYTVIGDVVNTASRLESLKPANVNRQDGIYISEEIRCKIEGHFEYVSLGLHQLKGIAQPVPVYQVTSKR